MSSFAELGPRMLFLTPWRTARASPSWRAHARAVLVKAKLGDDAVDAYYAEAQSRAWSSSFSALPQFTWSCPSDEEGVMVDLQVALCAVAEAEEAISREQAREGVAWTALLVALRTVAGVLQHCARRGLPQGRQLPETEPRVATVLARLFLADCQQVAVLRAAAKGTPPRAVARLCFGLAREFTQLQLTLASLQSEVQLDVSLASHAAACGALYRGRALWNLGLHHYRRAKECGEDAVARRTAAACWCGATVELESLHAAVLSPPRPRQPERKRDRIRAVLGLGDGDRPRKGARGGSHPPRLGPAWTRAGALLAEEARRTRSAFQECAEENACVLFISDQDASSTDAQRELWEAAAGEIKHSMLAGPSMEALLYTPTSRRNSELVAEEPPCETGAPPASEGGCAGGDRADAEAQASNDDEPWWAALVHLSEASAAAASGPGVRTLERGSTAPGAPRAVQECTTPTDVTVAWADADADATVVGTLYSVQWCRSSTKEAGESWGAWVFVSTPVVGRECSKGLLTPDTLYRFRVRAFRPTLQSWSAFSPPSAPIRTAAASEMSPQSTVRSDHLPLREIPPSELDWDHIAPSAPVSGTPRARVLLGRGGCGAVFRAQWRGRPVAVKELPPLRVSHHPRRNGNDHRAVLAEREARLLALRNEAAVLAFLSARSGDEGTDGTTTSSLPEQHRSEAVEDGRRFLCALLGAFFHPPNIYIVLEFCDLGNLEEALHSPDGLFASPARDFAKRVLAARQIALALAYLHSHGIVFRDLKPQNVLLERCGSGDNTARVRLVDFGISLLTNGTNTGKVTLAGTFPYLSPEVFRVGAVPSDACDVWAYGVLLWELHTLTKPWDGVEEADISIAVALHGARPGEASENAEAVSLAIPPSWKRVIDACLEKIPVERPKMEEILALPNVWC